MTAATKADVVALLQTALAGAQTLPDPVVVPPAGTYPAWRAGKTKGVPFLIPGTQNMSGIAELQGGGALGGFGTIDAWNGLAADDTTLYSLCNGGHGFPWNGDYRLDLWKDAPGWIVARPSTTGAAVTTAEYYADGTACARHTYYTLCKVGRKVIMPGCSAPFGTYMTGALYGGGGETVVYDLDSLKFDPHGAHPNIPNYGIATSICQTSAGLIYASYDQHFNRFDPAANAWTPLPTPTLLGDANWIDQTLEFHPSLIDEKRGRYLCFNNHALYQQPNLGPQVMWCGLDFKQMTRVPITAALTNVSDYAAAVYDADGDRYVVASGSALYAVDPTTFVSVKLADTPAPAGGWNSRVRYMPPLGGIAYVPSFAAGTLFLPTR